jgi:hypothetical protein
MKKAIYYAILGGIHDHECKYLRKMDVTSLKRDKDDKVVMLYGRNEAGVQTTHSLRNAHYTSSPRLYLTEKARDQTLERAKLLSEVLQAQVVRVQEQLTEVSRNARLQIERVLNEHEVNLDL